MGPDIEVFFLSGSNVDQFREQYRITEQFQLFAPSPDGRVSFLSLDQMAIYVEDLWTGLHFFISEFVRNLLHYYCLCPAQLASNSIRLIISFALLCHIILTNPWPSLFHTFFILRPHPKAKG